MLYYEGNLEPMKNNLTPQERKPEKPLGTKIPDKEPGRPLGHPAWDNSAIPPGILKYDESSSEKISVGTLQYDKMDCMKNLDSSGKKILD